MSPEELEARRQDVLRRVRPTNKTLIEYLMNNKDFAGLKAQTQTEDCGMFYEAALQQWIDAVQVAQCQNGVNAMTIHDDPMLTMILNATDSSQQLTIRQYFNAKDYANLDIIVAALSYEIQDAFFYWKGKNKKPAVPTPNNPPIPNRQYAAGPVNYANQPTYVANNANGTTTAPAAAVRKTKTGKPLGPTQRQYEEVGEWAIINMDGYNALEQNKASIQQARKQHDCIFMKQPVEGHQPARYRVLADTKAAVLFMNQLAIQIMSATQREVWNVYDVGLRAYIGNLAAAELVAIQQRHGVFIAGAEIRGWLKGSATQCHTELNNAYRAANNLPPMVPYAGSQNGGYRGRVRGRGRAGNNNYGNRAPPQAPPRFEPNENFKELLKNIDTYPEEMNILLLGETGAGKSTLINGIVNYLKHGTIENAMRGGVEIAIASRFSLTGKDGDSVEIRCDPTIFTSNEDTSNEGEDNALSCTQDPKAYVFRFRVNGEEKMIRFIDTPGIMDTDGAEKDKVNFDKILKHITHYQDLHAICVVMNSNKARLTATFKYCIDELLVHLHHEASRNLLFCFTNCRDTFDSAGDSVTTLRKHLKDLEEKRDVRILLTQKQQYSFDNGCVRYLCAKQKNWVFNQRDIDANTQSWNMSAKSLFRMLDRVSNMEPHSVRKTLGLNNTRNLLMRLSRPLADVTRMLVFNGRYLGEEQRKLNYLIATHADLSQRKTIKKMGYVAKQLDYPMTVCVDDGCVKYVQDSDGLILTEYAKQCHSHCYLTGVEAETFPNKALRHCAAMSGENCGNCNCSWQSHMHIRYQLMQTMKEIENEDVKRSIENNESAQEIARKQSMALEKEIREANNAVAVIKKTASEFAMFLKKNALLPYGDSYLDYIGYLIKEEKGKILRGGSSKCHEELEKFKREYEEQVKLLQAATVDDPSKVLTIAQAEIRINELMNLDSCKEYLKEVQKLELLSLNTEVTENDRIVPLENSWLLRNLQ